MAQNGKLSQDVGSEEGYRRQLSMHKIAAMKKTVLTVAVVAAVAVGLVLFIERGVTALMISFRQVNRRILFPQSMK